MRDTKNSELLTELLQKQLKNVPIDKKLRYADLKRLCKYLNVSIFDENICSLWKGYVTNTKNISKGVYINFYFKGKKTSLHRLLYINFVDNLSVDEYLKFSCEHKGKCCNITHLKKFPYLKKPSEPKINEIPKPQNVILKKEISFLLSFD